MFLALAVAASSSSIPAWLQLLVASGIVVVVLPAASKQFGKIRDNRRAMKTAPVLKDAQAIKELRSDMNRVNGWLLGNKSPFTGEYVGDGFKDTFPVFQKDVIDRLEALKNGGAK